jgi:uncharacterized protein YuzE
MISQTFDPVAGALYLELAKGEFGRTVQIDETTLVDLGTDGRVLGVEILLPAPVPAPVA